MNSERWRKIEELYHAAQEHEPGERRTFLAGACLGDDELEREVEFLLAQESAGNILDGRALDLAADSKPITSLSAGDQLGPYKIEARIGAGGMGEVFRARDTRLGRTVALKRAKADFGKRFEREARAVAALNHPNICTLHDVGPNYLVMEFIEGESPKGPLPVEAALGYALQIAAALEAAHEKGIVHRDLKPANIKVKPDGTVKVLDFGLAKSFETPPGDPLSSPTRTMAETEAGTILGTAAYMSPEQASGKPADKRADIWSFGAVLWEFLAGRRLFEGETVSHTLAEVLRGPIDFAKLPRETPAAIRVLLRRCLERDAKNRLRDIGEARIAIESVLSGNTQWIEPAPESGGTQRPWLAWSVAAAAILGLAAVSFQHFREKPPAPAAPLSFQIPAEQDGLVSPDGRNLAMINGDRLGVHSLESGESRDLAAAEGAAPFWSPDSRFIGYLSKGKIKRIAVTGGLAQTVADFHGVFGWGCGAWNQDDVIVFGHRDIGLFRVPATGGVPVQLTALDPSRHENSHYCPSFLPDGRHFVYLRGSTEEEKTAVYLGSVDARPEQQSSRPLVASNSQPVYAPSADPNTGYLLFVSGTKLMAQPFDSRRLELKGKAVPVAEQVRSSIAGATYVRFSASANGVLVFPHNRTAGMRPTWFDRAGKVVEAVGEPGHYGGPNIGLSPDGTRLAVTKSEAADTGNIWLQDLSRGGASTRFTFSNLVDSDPVWSPDGSRIIFSSNRDGIYDLYQKPANSARNEEVLLKSSEGKHATSWSRDGRFLLYIVVRNKTKKEIWVLPLEGDRKPVPFLITEFNERNAQFSPDGRWVAYVSDESGQSEVYVRPFSMNPAGTAVEPGGKWPISNGPGFMPRWRGDGRELYYLSRDGQVIAVPVAAGPELRTGNPQPLGTPPLGPWEISPDGKRFLELSGGGGPQLYTVLLNWQAGLKK